MIADELRRQADLFTDLVELQGKISRDPPESSSFPAAAAVMKAVTLFCRGDVTEASDRFESIQAAQNPPPGSPRPPP